MNKGFRSLTERVIETLFELSPFFATSAGAHQYDHLLDRRDPEARAAFRSQLRDAIRELKAYENQQLTHAEQIDLSLLVGWLQAAVRFDDDVKPAERNAASYVNELLHALHHMATRDYAPHEERARALLERLKALPSYLDVATKNLKSGYDIPAVWTEIAIEGLAGADLFFKETLAHFAKKSGNLQEQLADAVEGSRRMLVRWRSFLKDELLPRCDGSFAIGRDCFEYILEKRCGCSLKTRELVAFGEEAIAKTRAEMERVAREIAPSKKLDAVLAEMKKNHPAPEKLLSAYEKEVKRARDFVAKKDLVTIPEGEKLHVVETPTFLRPLMAYAAYLPPAPLESKQDAYFFVTPIDKNAPADKQREQLEGQSLTSIAAIAVHEAYPGHHVQLCHASRASTKARRVLFNSMFAEGWALYCEELMLEEGFFSDPRARLEILRKQLWRACRVVIDTKIQLQQMSFDEAVDMLVNVAGLERAAAVAEVRWYTLHPTYPLSYLVGKREVLRIRDEARQQKGEKFKLKDFHDKLLSFGTIPLNLLRDALLK